MSRQPLFRKYVTVFVVLVSATLLISGLLQAVFTYQENQAALVALQREKASGAAAIIAEFVNEVERQLAGAVPAPLLAAGPITPEQRRDELLRLLRQAPAVTEVSYLDGGGREQVRLSRLATSALASGIDRSAEPAFTGAKTGRTYFSNVYFRNESEPYMSIGVPDGQLGDGVTLAEVNLKLIWDVVSRIRVGEAGSAYVVDDRGQLVAHPEISFVLQRADLSGLPQVQAALAAGGGEVPTIARDLLGRQVLTARAVIDRLGWSVFAEQPLEEAFAPLYASLLRTALTLFGGLVLSVVASLVLARRMTRPIQQLQAGAARIGAGALDQRIDVRTGDELEVLGDAFNHMTAQLRESYATLEQKVAERTRDLEEALERLRGLGEVSRAVGSTLDHEQVLATIVAHAVNLSGADVGSIYEFDEQGQLFRLRAAHGMSDDLVTALQATPIRRGETLIGQATEERQPIQVPHANDERASGLQTLVGQASDRALLALPLLSEDRIVGALVVRRRAPGEFGQDTVDLLQTFASQSVVAIQNARLFQEIAEKSRQLELASRHKSEFLANMSHELRTPLNAVIGFSQVLTDRLFGELNSKQEEYLRDILDSGRHLLSLINDILDLSKVEAGRMELELGTFSLAEALENGLTMVRERASRRGVALSLDIDLNIAELEADERKIKQVIFNLLSNAVKFTPDRGRVDVVARQVRDEIQVAVRDTGVGIAPEDQARIFEEFQQARHGSQMTEGTGLGLALARRFVELHRGRIWVESRVGVGSTFTFSLPMQRHSGRDRVSHPGDTNGAVAASTHSALVLLVEDNPQSVELLDQYLRAAGFDVAVAGDGEEGLRLARRLRPAAIVLDIFLPRLDGWEVLARAKADPAIADIPVIIVSMVDERGRGFALGAADYLVKPIVRDELVASLRRCAPLAPETVVNGAAAVLAIGGDASVLDHIEAVLGPRGFKVLSTSGGEEGIALACRESPALVILELLMPDMDGFTVVQRLRAEPLTANVPIVVLTSRGMTAAEKQRLNGRINALARKSDFDQAAFADLVRRLCPVPVS